MQGIQFYLYPKKLFHIKIPDDISYIKFTKYNKFIIDVVLINMETCATNLYNSLYIYVYSYIYCMQEIQFHLYPKSGFISKYLVIFHT